MTPDAPALFRVLDATWPPAKMWENGGWAQRDGAGGGKRVSAATALPGASPDSAPDLVQVRPWDADLDPSLAALGYDLVDETVLYLSSVADLSGPLPHASCYWSPERLAIMEEIWAGGGIGLRRLAVMDRVTAPRAFLLSRVDDRAAGVGFAAIAEGVAMLHAIEVAPGFRRRGAGRFILRGAANWAARRGAEWLALAVTSANAPARAMYEGLGMVEVGRYHYRMRTT